jgi:hypothetical protein
MPSVGYLADVVLKKKGDLISKRAGSIVCPVVLGLFGISIETKRVRRGYSRLGSTNQSARTKRTAF